VNLVTFRDFYRLLEDFTDVYKALETFGGI